MPSRRQGQTMQIPERDKCSAWFQHLHHLIQKHDLHGFWKKRPRQPRDEQVYRLNLHGIADSVYILDRVFEQWNTGMLGSENGGESRIDFNRCKLRMRAQLPQYIVGENAGSRTVFEDCIRTF